MRSVKGLRKLVSLCNVVSMRFKYETNELHEEIAKEFADFLTQNEIEQTINVLDKVFRLSRVAQPGANERNKEYWQKWYNSEKGKTFLNQYRNPTDNK